MMISIGHICYRLSQMWSLLLIIVAVIFAGLSWSFLRIISGHFCFGIACIIMIERFVILLFDYPWWIFCYNKTILFNNLDQHICIMAVACSQVTRINVGLTTIISACDEGFVAKLHFQHETWPQIVI